MHAKLPFVAPDPRLLPAPEGELFRRRVRALRLLESSEHVDSERRAEISREILVLGAEALPALHKAAAGRQENTAALARSLVRLLVPDEIGKQLYYELLREKRDYPVEQGAVLLSKLHYPNLPTIRVLKDIDALGRKAAEFIYGKLGVTRDEGRRVAVQRTLEIVKLLGEFWRDEGFHGNTEHYYNDRNTYLPDVLERHTGLPITLSILYLALARRVPLRAGGGGMTGRFLRPVRVQTNKTEEALRIYTFNATRRLQISNCSHTRL